MLEVAGVHAYYGKSHVLQGVHLRVGAGEIVGLLGRNGAGRSTTLKAIMGLVPAAGSICYRGVEILGRPSHELARLGLGYVPEERAIFPDLTVRQNLLLGAKGNGGARPDVAEGRWPLADLLRMFPRLGQQMDTPGGVLSGGEQQMLTLCRTLMGDPDLLMVDEPAEGLSPRMVTQVGELLQEVKRRGVALLLVEQKLSLALDISDRLYLMGHGQVVFEGQPRQLRDHPEMGREWLGV